MKGPASLPMRSVAALAPALSGAKRTRTRHSSPGAEHGAGAVVAGQRELVEIGADDGHRAQIDRGLAVVADGEVVRGALGPERLGAEVEAVGARVTAGATPSPRSVTIVPPSASPKKARRATFGPASWGVKRTWAVQLSPGISWAPLQLSSSSLKLPASPPATMPMKNPAG